MSNLLRFSDDVRDRAARFEMEIGILCLDPENLSLESIELHEAEIVADWARIAGLPGVTWYVTELTNAKLSHCGDCAAGKFAPWDIGFAREQHYRATKETLLRGRPVHRYSIEDHWDRLKRDTQLDLYVNGNLGYASGQGTASLARVHCN
jgi:hypothetical protein